MELSIFLAKITRLHYLSTTHTSETLLSWLTWPYLFFMFSLTFVSMTHSDPDFTFVIITLNLTYSFMTDMVIFFILICIFHFLAYGHSDFTCWVILNAIGAINFGFLFCVLYHRPCTEIAAWHIACTFMRLNFTNCTSKKRKLYELYCMLVLWSS